MKKLHIIVIICILVLLVGFGAYKITGNTVKDTTKETSNTIEDTTKEFTIKAFRFGYTPDTITVDRGDNVRIKIDNTDTLHGIRIPDLGIKGDDSIEFIAQKTGEFDWYCANICGDKHGEMKGKLIVK